MMPFSGEQYFGALSRYNLEVWPAHVVIYVLGLLILFLAYKKRKPANIALAFLWVWVGAVFFMRYVGPISPAGYVEGAVCFVQAFLCLKIQFSPRSGKLPSAGAVLIFYAMVAYPTLGAFTGHGLEGVQSIGLQDPTAIYTMGLIMWAAGTAPSYVLVIPLMIAAGGTVIGLSFGVYENLGLLVSGALAVAWLNERRKESPLHRLREQVPSENTEAK